MIPWHQNPVHGPGGECTGFPLFTLLLVFPTKKVAIQTLWSWLQSAWMKNLGRSLKNPKSSPFKLYYFLNKILSKMYIFQSILYYPPRCPKITLVNPPLNKGPPAKHYYILLYCCVLLYTTAHYCVLLCTAAYYCVLLCTTVYYRVLLHTTVSCTCQYYCVLLRATESYRVLLFAESWNIKTGTS